MFRKVFAWVLVVVFLMGGFMCTCFRPNNLLHAHSRSKWEEGMDDRRRRYPGRRRRRRRQVQQEERMEQAVPEGDEETPVPRAAAAAGLEGSTSASKLRDSLA